MAILSFGSLGNALLRRKKIESGETTKLDRCLTTLDLTALGIGSTLGLGIYVLAGQVASTKAGPAVIISFLIAAVASVFAGLCYAEFGARVPRAGSAYIYSYVTVGELMAFIIGWNLVLEYVIGTASVARGYSGYIDSLVNGTIAKQFRHWMPMNVAGFSEYPDFLAFSITLLLTIMLAVGVRESTRFNSVFTCLNLVVVLYVIICGSFKVDFHNWNLSEDEIPKVEGKNYGTGGFMPFGFSGMMAGAATCFYGFIGFDVIATTGEEVKNPQKAIPIATVMSLLFIFLAYFGVSGVQTLMWPYWDQNNDAPLPYVFASVGWPVAKWIISVGALAGLSTSLLGAMFPLPRVLYAMATDGIIFRSLAEIHPRYKTPLLATILSGVFAGSMAAVFNVAELADMMSIGTLLAYSLVAICVLVLRFQDEDYDRVSTEDDGVQGKLPFFASYKPEEIMRQIFNVNNTNEVTPLSSKLSIMMVITICGEIVILDALLIMFEDEIFLLNPAVIVAVLVALKVLVTTTVALSRQPRSTKKLSFSVPLVPFLPVLSVTINVYLMLKLTTPTWIRFGIWMILGLSIYIFYGFKNSTGAMTDDEKQKHMVKNDEKFDGVALETLDQPNN